MKKRLLLVGTLALAVILLASTGPVFAWPSIYPRGLTINKLAKVAPGYILFYPHAPGRGAILIDNQTGKIVKEWKHGGMAPELLPNGHIFLSEQMTVPGLPGYYTGDLTEFDWDGNKVWQWNGEAPGRKKPSSPYHHDFVKLENGNVLILGMDKVNRPEISDKVLMDDVFWEVTPSGKVVWELYTTDILDQIGFSDEEKKLIYEQKGLHGPDWAHSNDCTVVLPNKWFNKGDDRFKPGNLLTDFRSLNTTIILDKETKKIVWQLGPNYPDGKVDQIIGQHDAHMIPKGYPGEGNILIFDNGGAAGYPRKIRGWSRVVEVDPVKKEIVWMYEAKAWGEQGLFFSNYVSNAQRLDNGNTFIDEGYPGRLFEVTKAGEIVWEWLSPWVNEPPTPVDYPGPGNYIYRAYKYPRDYCPQFKDLE